MNELEGFGYRPPTELRFPQDNLCDGCLKVIPDDMEKQMDVINGLHYHIGCGPMTRTALKLRTVEAEVERDNLKKVLARVQAVIEGLPSTAPQLEDGKLMDVVYLGSTARYNVRQDLEAAIKGDVP